MRAGGDGVVAQDATAGAAAAAPMGRPADWPTIGGGLEQSLARSDAPFDAISIRDVGVRWSVSAAGGVTGTPVIREGVVYWGDWARGVHATAVQDGAELWISNIPGGVASSVFASDDAIYVSSRGAEVHALERGSGARLWRTRLGDSPAIGLWSSPVVVEDVVIIGVSARASSAANIDAEALAAFRGAVVGLDRATGAVRWRFETTSGTGGERYGAGVSCWSSAAVDVGRKLAFIGTGNSFYAPASPFSDALLALDYSTDEPAGQLMWARQFTADDNFTSGSPAGPDSDVGATPNLFSLDGEDYVGVGSKDGAFYVMRRETGDLVFKTRVSPGSSIGGIMAAAAYADGVIYVTANASGGMVLSAIDARSGELRWTRENREGGSLGSPLVLSDILLVSPAALFPSRPKAGTLFAYRLADGGEVDWTLPLPNQHAGGISLYDDTILVPAGFAYDNPEVERVMTGHLIALSR